MAGLLKAIYGYEGRAYEREPPANYHGRVEISLAMARECAMSRARAERQVLNAVSEIEAAELPKADRALVPWRGAHEGSLKTWVLTNNSFASADSSRGCGAAIPG